MEGTREKSRTAKRKVVRKLNNPFLSSLHPRNDTNKKKKKKKHDQYPRMLSKLPMGSDSLNKRKEKKGLNGMAATKFGEFLEMERANGPFSMEEDMKTMEKFGKKLKVKDGLLDGEDDGFNLLLEGLPSEVDFPFADPAVDVDDDDDDEGLDDDAERTLKPEAVLRGQLGKKHKRENQKLMVASERGPEKDKTTKIENGVSDQYPALVKEEPRVEAPALDASMKYVAPRLRASLDGESEELSQVRRRVRGLLNRLSESNVESITGEVVDITRSIGRSAACQIIGLEVISSCSRGPRGNEQYAAIFAAFVAGMACLVGMDFSARLLAFVAESFEDEYSRKDNLSMRNLTLLLAYLCIFGVCSSDLIYDLLAVLSKRLTELDVSTILTLLQCCGMKLRSDDPTAMKNFVLSIQNRVNALRTADDAQDGQSRIKSKRMKFMLETICDIKNNKRRPKEDSAHHTRIKKWLQKLRAEDVVLRGLKWSKLLDPEKKGQWWLSGEIVSASYNVEEVATPISKEIMESQKLIELAAAQRMNTDIRRAVFCIIMSAEDYIDCFEKILRLDLSGKQDREVMRVLVDCCLQEKVFNKYYTVLASKLCNHDKNHKFSLQYCLWDHFKEVETMDLHLSMNLARFVAEMISSFTLSLSLLKTVDLTDLKQLTPRRIMHFRMLLESILGNSDALVWNIFSRLATIPELELLRDGLKYFIKQYVVAGESFARKLKIVDKALDNAAGVLM